MAVDFFANGLCFYCHVAKNELIEYQNIHAQIECLWKSEDEKIQAQVQDLLQRYPDSEEQEIVESYAWEMHLNQFLYPDINRSSLLVTLYTFLEQQLNGLCEILSESLGAPIRVEDLSGKGVERALLFLRKVALFDLGRVSSLSFVKGLNRLRNRIVHAGGLLPLNPQDKLNKFVVATPGLHGEPGAYVKLTPEFIDCLINRLTQLFDELDKQVQQFIGKAQ